VIGIAAAVLSIFDAHQMLLRRPCIVIATPRASRAGQGGKLTFISTLAGMPTAISLRRIAAP